MTESQTQTDLKPLFEQAQMNLLRLGQWQIKHVRREQNKRADELVNRALDRQADVIESDTGAQPESDAPPPAKAKPAPAATTRPSREALGDAPRFTARLAYEPGPDCPAELKGGRTYRFGPRIPAGFCVFATATLLQEGPEAVCSGQRTCQRCGTTIEVERLDPSGSESGANP